MAKAIQTATVPRKYFKDKVDLEHREYK